MKVFDIEIKLAGRYPIRFTEFSGLSCSSGDTFTVEVDLGLHLCKKFPDFVKQIGESYEVKTLVHGTWQKRQDKINKVVEPETVDTKNVLPRRPGRPSNASMAGRSIKKEITI